METKELSIKQLKCAVLLASGLNYRKTCIELGITRDTLHKWRKIPEFQTAINEEKEKQLCEFRQEYIELKGKCLNTLSKFLDDNSVSTTEKIAICFHALALPQSIKVNYLN